MTIVQFLKIVELRTKIVSLSTFVLALLYALYRNGSVPPVLAVLTFLAALAVDMGTTAFNSYFDYLRQVDHRQENREEDKVLVHEGLEPREALLAAVGCYAAAVILGGTIALLTGPEIAAAGAVCMAVGFLYTGGPKPVSGTPFGELFAGGFLGGVFFLIVVYILTGSIDGRAVLAALPSTLMIASILAVNNACDIAGDTRAGRRTLAILLGPGRAAQLIPVLGAVTLTTLIILSLTGLLPILTALAALAVTPAALLIYRRMLSRGFSHANKGLSMRSVSRILILYTLAYAGGLLTGVG